MPEYSPYKAKGAFPRQQLQSYFESMPSLSLRLGFGFVDVEKATTFPGLEVDQSENNLSRLIEREARESQDLTSSSSSSRRISEKLKKLDSKS